MNPRSGAKGGASPLDQVLKAERAFTLGKLGREVEAKLAALRDLESTGTDEQRLAAAFACADAVWRYFIQRESHGLMTHEPVIEYYRIPEAVLAKVGARRP